MGTITTPAATRDDEVLHRVDGHGLERVDLLGRAHVAELGGHARTRRAATMMAVRGHLAMRARTADDAADHVLRAESPEAVDGRTAKTMPVKKPTSPTGKSRLHPDKPRAASPSPGAGRAGARPRDGLARELAEHAHLLHRLERGSARGAQRARGRRLGAHGAAARHARDALARRRSALWGSS